MTTYEWRKLLQSIRKSFPIENATIIVIRQPMKHNCGLTRFDGIGKFIIRIDSLQSDIGQSDSLIHEWAHAMAIAQAYHHQGPWGVLYARIYDRWVRNWR